MGTPVPPGWPHPEPCKWYIVVVNKHFDPGPYSDCGQAFVGRGKCCERGDTIDAWIANDWECFNFHPICGYVEACHLLYTVGPYDTQQECVQAIW